MCVHDEVMDENTPLDLFDPVDTWKHKTVENYTAKELQVEIFKNGECIYDTPALSEIRDYCKKEISHLWKEVTRFENPHRYYVDLSEKLWNIKHALLKRKGK
jgi:nicotinate phosphoribosyltransferase